MNLRARWILAGLRPHEMYCRSVGDFDEATRINARVCRLERVIE